MPLSQFMKRLYPLALLKDARYVDEARAFICGFLADIPVTDHRTHGQRWDAHKRAVRDHVSVNFMSS